LDEALSAIGNDDRYRAAAKDVSTEIASMPPAAEAVRRLQELGGP
jgi:hypothetical protein